MSTKCNSEGGSTTVDLVASLHQPGLGMRQMLNEQIILIGFFILIPILSDLAILGKFGL